MTTLRSLPRYVTALVRTAWYVRDIKGSYAISTYIGMSQTTAINFASRYVNESFSVYDEYVQASLDDFRR